VLNFDQFGLKEQHMSDWKDLEALTKRREENAGRQLIDNSKLPAGSPMHFPCEGCNADIEVPEDYTPPRPTHCDPCKSLLKEGLLD
jgi:hypothetical protein